MNALKAWAKDAGLRAIKTAAQTAVALLGTDVAGLTHADWATVGITAGIAGGVSILHNLAALRIDSTGQVTPKAAVESAPAAEPAPDETVAEADAAPAAEATPAPQVTVVPPA